MSSVPRRLIARIAVVVLVASSLAVVTTSTSGAGPLPSGVFPVPAGHTLTVVDPYLSGCNVLAWGYEIDGEAPVVVDQWPGGCDEETYADHTLGPFPAPTSVRVFLTDVSCDATYYSDGTPVDHADVTGDGPWHVEIADAQVAPQCINREAPTEGANFAADIRVDPVVAVQKVVVGDDPGIAFPIVVSCTAQGTIPASVATDAEIVLDGPDATDAAEVDLAGGESAAIPLVLDSPYIDGATCTITESLAGVSLPEGYTCGEPIVDHPEVVLTDEGWSATPVTVTNTCRRAAVVEPTFTG